MGKDLCKSLDLKQQDFFYHLLKDILPEEIFKSIIKPSQQAVFETVSDEIERLSVELESLRKAYGKTLTEDPFQVDDNDVDYLSENFYLLPIIHYIYMRKSCSFADIQEIINKNGIRKDLNYILYELKHRMWAVVDEKQKVVIRHKRNFRIPRTPKGIRFKDRFLLHEAKLSMEDGRRVEIVSPNNTFQHSSIFCVSPKKGAHELLIRWPNLQHYSVLERLI